MAAGKGKSGKCGEGSPKMPKQAVKNVKGGDKLQKGVNKINSGKNNR